MSIMAVALVACGSDDNADGSKGDENAPTIAPTMDPALSTPTVRAGSDGSMAANRPPGSPAATPGSSTPEAD